MELARKPGASPHRENGVADVTADPLVSVVLPCFDAERFLPEALDSLLTQTYRHLEIVAIDDGSRDATPLILQQHAARDPRVRVLQNRANVGLIETLNRGVSESDGEFIARMDADDVSAPDRIERQVNALLQRSDSDIVGAGIRLVDKAGRRLGTRPPRCRGPEGARFMALFATPLGHPTLLARANVLRSHRYGGSPNSLHTEDYELFTRMLCAGVRFLNLREFLVSVRVRSEGVSLDNECVQIQNFIASARGYLDSTFGARLDSGAHRVLVNRINGEVTAAHLAQGLRCLDRLEAAFLRRGPSSAPEIRGIADEQRLDILVQAGLRGAPGVRFAAGPLALRYARRLLSPTARRYLGAKLVR